MNTAEVERWLEQNHLGSLLQLWDAPKAPRYLIPEDMNVRMVLARELTGFATAGGGLFRLIDCDLAIDPSEWASALPALYNRFIAPELNCPASGDIIERSNFSFTEGEGGLVEGATVLCLCFDWTFMCASPNPARFFTVDDGVLEFNCTPAAGLIPEEAFHRIGLKRL